MMWRDLHKEQHVSHTNRLICDMIRHPVDGIHGRNPVSPGDVSKTLQIVGSTSFELFLSI